MKKLSIWEVANTEKTSTMLFTSASKAIEHARIELFYLQHKSLSDTSESFETASRGITLSELKKDGYGHLVTKKSENHRMLWISKVRVF